MNHKSVCLNCGKKGHCSKTCRHPTNSYGCIVFKKSTDGIRYLMIQRKYTPEYIEIIRGHYYEVQINEINYQYLILLINSLSLIERNYIQQHSFDYLWKNIWQWVGTEDQMRKIQNDFQECQHRFNLLKNGHIFSRYGFLSFQKLFQSMPTTQTEPDWEFPKGKREGYETDQRCAIRECCEETALHITDFKVFLHVTPFQETFNGVNNIKYCNNYYLAELTNLDRLIYYNPNHIEQNKEIRKIGWFTIQDMCQIINPKCTYRIKIVNDINNLVNKLITQKVTS